MTVWHVLIGFATFVALLVLASKGHGSASGWSALARRFATNDRLEQRRERILTQQVIALKSAPGFGGSAGDYATKLLVSVDGLYIETGGVRALATPRVLVPWPEIAWLSERSSPRREAYTLRLGRGEAYLVVKPAAFALIRPFLRA